MACRPVFSCGELRPSIESLEPRWLLSAGQLDATFGTGGIALGSVVPFGIANAAAIQSDGKVLAVGEANPPGLNAQFSVARYNRDGSVDRTFGSAGDVTTDFKAGFYALANAVTVQRDGKILVAGTAGPVALNSPEGLSAAVARYLPDGELDPSFGTGGKLLLHLLGDDQAAAVAVEGDGKILIAGTAADLGSRQFGLARLTARGTLDRSFGRGGEVLTDFSIPGGTEYQSEFGAMLLQPDGRIVLAGQASDSLHEFLALARYRADGSPDSTFGSGGKEIASNLGQFTNTIGLRCGAALEGDGKIVLAGEDATSQSMKVVRLKPNGAVDTAFGTGGAVRLPAGVEQQMSYPTVQEHRGTGDFTVLVQRDGRIVAVATHTLLIAGPDPHAASESTSFLLARFTARGVLDSTFGHGGITETAFGGFAEAHSAALQGDGRIVVVGEANDFTVTRYTANGVLDDTFGHYGAAWRPNGLTGMINAVAVQRDGKAVVAGYEAPPDPSKPTDAALVRYNSNGSIDTTFGKDGHVFLHVGSDAEFNALVVEANGDIVAGGYAHGSIDHFLLARYLPSGAPDLSFGTGGQVVTGFDYRAGERCTALAVESDGDIVAVGSVPSVRDLGSPPHGGQIAVARYLPNGKLDSRFAHAGKLLLDPLGGGAQAAGVAVMPDSSVYIGATLYPDFGVIRLRPDGFLDRSFGTNGVATSAFTAFGDPTIAQAAAMIIDSRGRILLGGAASPDGLNTSESQGYALSRFLPNGRLDHSFGSGGNLLTAGSADTSDTGQVLSLAVQRDGRIVAGTTGGVARFTDNGRDTSFGTGGFARVGGPLIGEPAVNSVALQADGKILAGGLELYRWTAR